MVYTLQIETDTQKYVRRIEIPSNLAIKDLVKLYESWNEGETVKAVQKFNPITGKTEFWPEEDDLYQDILDFPGKKRLFG